MDWIKVLNRHTLFEYEDLLDSEFRAWIKIMSLTAYLERIPDRDQMLKHTRHKTLDSLQEKFKKHSTTIQDVLKKVVSDAQAVSIKRNIWKQNKQQYRDANKNVSMDVSMDVSIAEKRREEKRREDIKKVKKESKLPLTDEQWFFEIKKNPAYKPLNIETEKAKCEAWCMTNGKVMSRRRLINWLNRAEKPMEGGSGRRPGHGGGPGVQTTPREWEPETPPSPEQIAENKRRIAALMGGIGA